MKLFYHPDPYAHILDEEESLHAIKVLRLKKGDLISVLDGKGSIYEAEITEANPKKCGFRIIDIQKQENNRNYYLHVAVAPTKSIDRIEWFLEKAVETGIDEISFILCEHSERKQVNMERIQKIAVSAMKQSMNTRLPTLNAPVSFSKFLTENKSPVKYIAHLEEGERKLFKHLISDINNLLVMIGPEGDFSKEEVSLALQHNSIPVSLGDSRLRTETAALAVCFICNTLKQ